MDELLNQQFLLLQQASSFNRVLTQRNARRLQEANGTCSPTFCTDAAGPVTVDSLRQPFLGFRQQESLRSSPTIQPKEELDVAARTTTRQMSASGTVSPVPAVPAFIPSARSSPRSAVAAAQAVAGTPGRPRERADQRGYVLNADDMRRKLRDCFKKDHTIEQDNLRSHGQSICASVVRSSFFNTVVLVMIVLNSIWIAIDIDFNKHQNLFDAPFVFRFADNVFCGFFTFELIVRLGAMVRWEQILDGWFLFDSMLTIMMIWDTWVQAIIRLLGGQAYGAQVRSFTILRILRILRVLRVARAARIINSLPELRVLVKGMAIAMRSTFTILALLLIVVYIFAVLFTQMLSGNPIGYGWFESVPQSMNFLLLQTLAGADVNVINKLLAAGWTYYFLYLSFVFMGSLTLMNMLIGVLCEVVNVVAQVEEERAFHDQAYRFICEFVRSLDMDGDRMLSRAEFLEVIERDPDLLMGLHNDFGIDVVAFCDNAIALFADCENIEVSDFVDLITQFRGQKQTTVKDLVDMRKFISMQLRHVADELGRKTAAPSGNSPNRLSM